MSESNNKEKRNPFAFMANVHPLTVIFFIIIFFCLLTYVVPGGQFERAEVDMGGYSREVVVPGTYTPVDSVPQSFSLIWTSFMEGAIESADISFLIFLCAGALSAIIATGAISSGIHSLIEKLKGHSLLLIPVLIFAFGLGGATYGMYEDAVPFVLIIAPIALSMGYDSLVGVMIVQYGVAIGFASGFINPFAVGIGQMLAQLPMYSGITVRIIIWIAFMALTSAYVMRYAIKVRRNPELSVVKEEDVVNRQKLAEAESARVKFGGRQALVLLLLALGFAIMIYGVIVLGWWFNELGSIFLFMGIVIPLIGGLSVNDMIKHNLEGAASLMVSVFVLSASRIIMIVLDNSNIMDTILFGISNIFQHVPHFLTVWTMYGSVAVFQALIGSSSGTAATLIPIMAPVGDLLEIPRQVVVTAYHLGGGTFGHFVPWDGISFAMCTLAGINFFKYIRMTAKFCFFWYIPAVLVTLTILTMIGFN